MEEESLQFHTVLMPMASMGIRSNLTISFPTSGNGGDVLSRHDGTHSGNVRRASLACSQP